MRPQASKHALRRELRQRRSDLSAQQQRRAAAALPRVVAGLPGWAEAACVALYMPAHSEIDTAPLAAEMRRMGKSLYLPVLQPGDTLAFAAWDASLPLCRNRFNIPEPDGAAKRCAPGSLDIVFMPLLGWDRRGGRLGMGGGFYDRALAGVAGPLRVGLAHDCQRVARVPCEPWDVALDFVATGSGLRDCRVG